MKRAEFNQLGLALTRNQADADIILELRHDVLTKYVYSAVDVRTQTVIAGGKASSFGGTVAGKVAKRFLKQLAQGPSVAWISFCEGLARLAPRRARCFPAKRGSRAMSRPRFARPYARAETA